MESIGLFPPQVTYLMKKLKRVIPDINDNIFTIEEAKAELLKYLGAPYSGSFSGKGPHACLMGDKND